MYSEKKTHINPRPQCHCFIFWGQQGALFTRSEFSVFPSQISVKRKTDTIVIVTDTIDTTVIERWRCVSVVHVHVHGTSVSAETHFNYLTGYKSAT